MKEIRNFFPRPAASCSSVFNVGLVVPHSRREMLDCLSPHAAASSFCVMPFSLRAFAMSRITSYSASVFFSWSQRKMGSPVIALRRIFPDHPFEFLLA